MWFQRFSYKDQFKQNSKTCLLQELRLSIEKVQEEAKQQAQDEKQNFSFLSETQIDRLQSFDSMVCSILYLKKRANQLWPALKYC